MAHENVNGVQPHPISYLENTSYNDEQGIEVVVIEKAIHATQLAELMALQWATQATPSQITKRINALQASV